MSTLHVLSHSPFGDERLGSCLRVIGPNDALLLSGDAAYALQPGTAPFSSLFARNLKLFVLAEDAQARALQVPDWASAIDYPAFVELSIHYDKVNSWL
ncbi:sulfurtransferase complex subunit TusB [Pseudomonas frederiksbergensis]|uniref:Sulfurtransferase complex subunit TusB n=1 Tax=Pseudomonas frederiksbergensis TaxID=104087 RepID=A0AB33E9L6_9PSED|nr:sulfurtransferase complex subunit TusB [Pseudomonas frederiksbergensis]ATE77009.1 sulfurtransferase complex subunit TusB [Pseudomonas frederiksbergensis]